MAAETLPNTMVRFKLKPGTHTFTLDFEGERQVATVDGKAGDLRFLRIDGTVWAWKSTFVWATDGEDAIRERAYKGSPGRRPDGQVTSGEQTKKLPGVQ